MIPFLVHILIVLVIVALLLWIVQQIPMDPTIARIIHVVAIVFVCLWLIYVLAGVYVGLPPMRR